MYVNSLYPIVCLQIFLLTLSFYSQAQEPFIQNISSNKLSYRVHAKECRSLDTSYFGWSKKDLICVQTLEHSAPESISHFVTVIRNNTSTHYFLADPVYSEYDGGEEAAAVEYPSMTYLLISLDSERVGVGSIEFVFKTVRDLENFDIHFITGITPERLLFVSDI